MNLEGSINPRSGSSNDVTASFVCPGDNCNYECTYSPHMAGDENYQKLWEKIHDAHREGKSLAEMTLSEMDFYWEEAKKNEKNCHCR